MPFSGRGYDPETIAYLVQCLDVAMEKACRATGSPPSDDLRKRLALAIMEGVDTDLGNQDDLIDFALRSLPELRARLAN
ncbi:hypothetical protein G3545_06205 [Starkeya sp. ORNL1]|uniref:hypothetical protein n=1 Tax=Starkeya sp. ORNL1 TaxID=2709380 RepID=UPI001463FFF8|nr:hypothetical protein [Starkeya sp. ORNL1]QJP13278.1 hypothetical protein G3545_06205 [Starkeya sp. ORNL1]